MDILAHIKNETPLRDLEKIIEEEIKEKFLAELYGSDLPPLDTKWVHLANEVKPIS